MMLSSSLTTEDIRKAFGLEHVYPVLLVNGDVRLMLMTGEGQIDMNLSEVSGKSRFVTLTIIARKLGEAGVGR